jgi:hypothetical protein
VKNANQIVVVDAKEKVVLAVALTMMEMRGATVSIVAMVTITNVKTRFVKNMTRKFSR